MLTLLPETDTIGRLQAENDRLRRRLASHIRAEAAGLSRVEERILRVLMMNAPAIVSRDEIRTRAFCHQNIHLTETNIVDVHISRMRGKLDPFGVTILTHRNAGYSIDPLSVAAMIDQEAA